jgi:hypothetical protein
MDGQNAPTLTQDPAIQATAADRPAYEAPRVTVMDETEVLKVFQFTSAAVSWWVM